MSQLFTSHGSLVATGLGVYVAGVTLFAKKEAETSGRGGLIFGQVVLNLGLLIVAVWIAPHMDSARALATLGVIAVVINRRALQAVADRRPARVQAAVRIMLLSIITIDAVVIYTATGDAGTALAVVALLIPSLLLGKWMTMT
jgi:4-hydroxybenzoate polyprenyltransferase